MEPNPISHKGSLCTVTAIPTLSSPYSPVEFRVCTRGALPATVLTPASHQNECVCYNFNLHDTVCQLSMPWNKTQGPDAPGLRSPKAMCQLSLKPGKGCLPIHSRGWQASFPGSQPNQATHSKQPGRGIPWAKDLWAGPYRFQISPDLQICSF